MRLIAQHKVNIEMYDFEKESGNEKIFINRINYEVGNSLCKEITKHIEVKEVTERYLDKPDERISVPVEFARNRLGYLMFESEIHVISKDGLTDLAKNLNLLYNTQMSCYQLDLLERIKNIINQKF